MWRSPDTAPLDAAEMARVHRLHDWLGLVKECLGCEQPRPMADFARFGSSFCRRCAAPELRLFNPDFALAVPA